MIAASTVASVSEQDLDHVIERTRELWTEARGQSFFITGGTGFFGRWLLDSFIRANDVLELDARAVVLTRDPAKILAVAPYLAARSDVRFVQGDMGRFEIPTGEFRYVVHAATEVGTSPEAAARIVESTIDGTRRVLELAQRCGTAKLLFTSSGAVYGRQPADMTHVSETYSGAPDPLLTASAYGEVKRLAEHLCASAARLHGFEAKIARCFAFVGPHLPLDGAYAIGNFIGDALAGRTIRIQSDGTPRRSYLYAADLAVWLWTILFRGANAEAYNVGSENDYSLKEIAETVGRVIAGTSCVDVAQMPNAGAAPARYVPSTAKARTMLGLTTAVPLEEAIRRTAQWHRQSEPRF